jgi:hypothetical protein
MTRNLIILVISVLIIYGLVEAWPLLAGPSLSIASPMQDAPYPGGIVNVRGQAVRAAQLSLNGAPVFHDPEGNFSSTLTFPHGGSILSFPNYSLLIIYVWPSVNQKKKKRSRQFL